jgi:hypothetical protein
MQFKTSWIKEQWPKVDHRIRIILSFVDFYVKMKYGFEIVVTCLLRTQQEQYAIYGPDYKKKSVHQYGRGGDFRCKDWPQHAIDDVKALLEKIPDGKGNYKTVLVHKAKNGEIHFHVQVKYE